jgi:hypothetical protein
MISTAHYCNRDVDASLMVRRLHWGLSVPTAEATEQLEQLRERRSEAVSNYKATRPIDHLLGELSLLLNHRKMWSEQGPFDDCSHWCGNFK